MQTLHRDTHSGSHVGKGGTYSPPHLSEISRAATKAYSEEIAESRHLLRRGDYSLHLADPTNRCREAGALVKRMYSWRGYDTQHISFSAENLHQLTVEAMLGKNPVGTLTVGLDSAQG